MRRGNAPAKVSAVCLTIIGAICRIITEQKAEGALDNSFNVYIIIARSKPRGPAKLDALRQIGTRRPHPQLVTDPLFQSHPFFDARDLMQVKYEMLRQVEVDGAPVSAAATAFGLSRPSFYQAQSAFQQGGLAGLAPQKRGPRRAHKLSAPVLEFLGQLRLEQPAVRYEELAERVRERFGLVVNPRSIERRLQRGQKKHVEPGKSFTARASTPLSASCWSRR
jgi:transposase